MLFTKRHYKPGTASVLGIVTWGAVKSKAGY